MRFLCLIYGDPAEPVSTGADLGAAVRARLELCEPATATTVRVRDGRPLLRDGPASASREQLAAVLILDAADLAAAAALAATLPAAGAGSVEIRPVRAPDVFPEGMEVSAS